MNTFNLPQKPTGLLPIQNTPNTETPSRPAANVCGDLDTSYPSLNDKFQPETETPCPCCQQMSLEKAYQPPMIATRAGYWMYHCKNPDCKGVYRTMKLEQFTATFGVNDE